MEPSRKKSSGSSSNTSVVNSEPNAAANFQPTAAANSRPASTSRRRPGRNPLRARNSKNNVAGRRQRRVSARNSLANRLMNAEESFMLINNYFADCEFSLLGCQQQLARLGKMVCHIFENRQCPPMGSAVNQNIGMRELQHEVAVPSQYSYQNQVQLPVLAQNGYPQVVPCGPDFQQLYGHNFQVALFQPQLERPMDGNLRLVGDYIPAHDWNGAGEQSDESDPR